MYSAENISVVESDQFLSEIMEAGYGDFGAAGRGVNLGGLYAYKLTCSLFLYVINYYRSDSITFLSKEKISLIFL